MTKRAMSLLLLVSLVAVIVLFGDCQIVFEQEPQYRYGNFARTVNKYRETIDWAIAVRSELGTGWRVADWNDLKSFYNNGGNLVDLLNALGITSYRDWFWLTNAGEKNYTSDRYYFAERHNGSLPWEFYAHENLGNFLLSLGSWRGMELPILAYKK